MEREPRKNGWGGRRPGAGRKPKGEWACVPHESRPKLPVHRPVHVVLRLRPSVGDMRDGVGQAVLDEVLWAAVGRHGLRITHAAPGPSELHLVVELEEEGALSVGMQAFSVRLARRLNRARGQKGTVFSDRYEARSLATEREARACLLLLGAIGGELARGPGIGRCEAGPMPLQPPRTGLLRSVLVR